MPSNDERRDCAMAALSALGRYVYDEEPDNNDTIVTDFLTDLCHVYGPAWVEARMSMAITHHSYEL